VIRAITTGNSPEFSGGFSYYAVGASIFFIAVSLLFGGLFGPKSDRDYLLTLPLSVENSASRYLQLSFVGFRDHHPLPLRILSCGRWNPPNHNSARSRPSDSGGCSHCTWRRFEYSLDQSQNRARAILGVWCLSSILGTPLLPFLLSQETYCMQHHIVWVRSRNRACCLERAGLSRTGIDEESVEGY